MLTPQKPSEKHVNQEKRSLLDLVRKREHYFDRILIMSQIEEIKEENLQGFRIQAGQFFQAWYLDGLGQSL